MKRRSFLAGMIAAGVAPMIIKAGILMPVKEIIDPVTHATFSCWFRTNGGNCEPITQRVLLSDGRGIITLPDGPVAAVSIITDDPLWTLTT